MGLFTLAIRDAFGYSSVEANGLNPWLGKTFMQTKWSFLKGRSTGYLLKLLHGKGLKWGWRDEQQPKETISLLDKNTNQSFDYILSEIRDELNRRPHLPNKTERKKLIDIRKRKE